MIPEDVFRRVRLGALGLLLLGAGETLRAVPLKVACVGDSITEGTGLGNPATESYPAKLQRLLGADYQVRNFGVSGRTLLKKGDFPYWNESAYTQSRNFAPDIVIIKLGTNDAKPPNWRYGTNFVTDYEALIASYSALSSQPRILLATPCPVFKTGAFDINPSVVRTNIAPATRDLAARLGLEVVDFNARLASHGEWFPDTVHPNTSGTTVMATILWTAVTHAPAAPTNPPLQITRLPSRKLALAWPTEATGLVLQSATTLSGVTPPWLVVALVAVNDGTRVIVTNSLPTSPRFYRLWEP